jgi:hypothetical protein
MAREIDLNEVPPEIPRTVIPEDVYRCEYEVIDGGAGTDRSLTVSQAGFLLFLKTHVKVLSGKYRGTVIFDNINVEIDAQPTREKLSNFEKAVEMGQARVRAIVESARKIRSNDDSKHARLKRKLKGWGDIDGFEVWARIGIKPAKGDYPERNEVVGIVRPGDDDWPSGYEMDDDIPL